MSFNNFSEFKFIENSTIEYLSCGKLSDSVDVADKKLYVAALFALCVNSFQSDIITINEPLKYVGEQKIIAQELHLLKTPTAMNVLRNNFELDILISRAEMKIKDYFGITPLYLETLGDDELLMSIATDLPPEEALNKLHQFDNDWWIENEPLSDGKLCIDVVSI